MSRLLGSSSIVKRSVRIAGHDTSVSLEQEFWIELKSMADNRGMSLAALIAEIDLHRAAINLSSALRLAVVADLKRRAASKHGR